MKFSQIGRITLASLLSMAGCLGITACSRDYTLAYVYNLSAKNAGTGTIDVYQVDYQSGSLLRLPDSFPSNGQFPISLAATADQKNLFVVNRDSNNIAWYQIGTDGKLYGNKTYTTPGSCPLSVSIAPDTKSLYVLFQSTGTVSCNNATSTTAPTRGGIAIFPITSDSTGVTGLGTATTTPVGANPVSVLASPDNGFVYVIENDLTANNLLGFARNATNGALTPLPGTTINATATSQPFATGYQSGVAPAGIAEEPKGRYLYVTDKLSNQLIGYQITGGTASGVPTAIQSSPFTTGSLPMGVTVDPRGAFVYVANNNSSTVSAFALNKATGSLSQVQGSTSQQTGTGPTCVTVENALGIYLYTSNNIDNTVSGFQLNPSTGSLKNVQNTPFPASGLPTCAVAVANGSHATQIVQ